MKADINTILSYTKQDESTGCLEWTRCVNTDGYPRALVDGNANTKVHRLVWELCNGKQAGGYVVRHTCDNPVCINPDHLTLGSNADNMRDRDTRGRHGAAKLTHQDVRAVRSLYADGIYTARELSTRYGVSQSNIYSIIKRRHFKHVSA